MQKCRKYLGALLTVLRFHLQCLQFGYYCFKDVAASQTSREIPFLVKQVLDRESFFCFVFGMVNL